jgi:hypothetical protein
LFCGMVVVLTFLFCGVVIVLTFLVFCVVLVCYCFVVGGAYILSDYHNVIFRFTVSI